MAATIVPNTTARRGSPTKVEVKNGMKGRV